MFCAVVFDFDGLIMDTETPQYVASHRAWVIGWLQHLGLLEFFGAIITADDVDRVIPSPAAYLTCCQKLGVEPSDALAFEDSPHGAMAALNAGLACVVVTNPTTKPLSFPAVHRKLGAMTELPFLQLLKTLDVREDAVRIMSYNALGRGN